MHFLRHFSKDCFNLSINCLLLCSILVALPLCIAAPSGRPTTDTALAARFLAAHKSARANARHGHGHGHKHEHGLTIRRSHQSSPTAQETPQHRADPSASRYPRMLGATQAAAPRAVLTFQTRGGILDEDWFELGVTELEIGKYYERLSLTMSSSLTLPCPGLDSHSRSDHFHHTIYTRHTMCFHWRAGRFVRCQSWCSMSSQCRTCPCQHQAIWFKLTSFCVPGCGRITTTKLHPLRLRAS